jgi:hypothetical protein
MDYGLWIMDNGLLIIDYDYGLWIMDYGLFQKRI